MPTQKQMGKGASPAQAEASAVLELVERFSFFHSANNEPLITATYEELGDRALPLEQLAASVHHDPSDLDRARQALEGLKLSWTGARNLTREREYLIPFDWFYQINEFNGPAAGNSLEEALVQGLCELVERHVSALICREEPVLPNIDPASLKSPVARELAGKFERQGIRLYIKDFTQDMGLATIAAMAFDPATFPHLSEIVYTAGTAPDPEKAFIRALTEVAQLAGDFNTRSTFVASGLPKYTHLTQTEYLTGPADTIPIHALPNISHDNLKVEVERILAAMSGRGYEVYAINTTHPRIGIPAVYTIIPGAHFRERAEASSIPFFAAKIISAQDDLGRVLAGLKRLQKLYPEAYYLNFFLGEALLKHGLAREAIGLLEAALDMEPHEQDVPGILTYLGLACKELEDYGQAVKFLRQSAELDNERLDTFNLLGFCYYKTKEHEKAIKAFEHALKIDPSSGIDYANIGSNYREMGRIEQAISHYQTALELDPGLDWVRENLDRLRS